MAILIRGRKLSRWLVRIPGRSYTGPCARCSRWFYVQHDGSGRIVPSLGEEGLHKNCVCADIPVEFAAKKLPRRMPVGMESGEWLRKQPREEQQRILGVFRTRLLRRGILPLSAMYRRQDKGRLLRVRTLKAKLGKAPEFRKRMAVY